jgi:NAD(P)H-nitrite reductase large subunit
VADQKQGRIDAAHGVELARGVLAVAVDGGRLDAQLARDLFGVEVRVHQAQTFALSLRQQLDRAGHRVT